MRSKEIERREKRTKSREGKKERKWGTEVKRKEYKRKR